MATTIHQTGELKPAQIRQILINDLDLLVKLYQQMPAPRQREFWQLRVGRADKILFLMRWGGLERGKPIVLCS